MAPREPSSFAVRARPWLALALVAATVAPNSGCSRLRRSSMRPTFIGPATTTVVTPAATPCPAGSPCAGGVVAAPTTSIRPGFAEPGEVITSPSPPVAPAVPIDGKVTPSNGRPLPNGGVDDEPQLEEIGSPGAYRTPQISAPASARRGRTPLNLAPAASSPGRSPSASNTSTRSAAAERVAALAADPADLIQPPKADRAWKYIVVHHSAHPTGGYAQIDRDHKQLKNFQGCGYHFVIGNGTESPDGQIEVAKRWSDQKPGAHCRDGKDPAMNDYGIGICLVGDLDKTPPTPKQVEATKALIAYLQARYDIPEARTGTHAQVATGATDCPGRQFPVEALLGRVDLRVR